MDLHCSERWAPSSHEVADAIDGDAHDRAIVMFFPNIDVHGAIQLTAQAHLSKVSWLCADRLAHLEALALALRPKPPSSAPCRWGEVPAVERDDSFARHLLHASTLCHGDCKVQSKAVLLHGLQPVAVSLELGGGR